MPLNVTRRDIVFLLVAAGLVLLYVLNAGWGFALDDSWIHQTYGRNLGLHGQWAFYLGEPSAASTSPLYTVLLAIGYFLRLPYMLWTHFLGFVALAITAILSARLADKLLPNVKQAGWWVGLALLFTWHLIWAAVSGMETMLFGMLCFVLIFLALRESLDDLSKETRPILLRGFIFGVFTALATLARPDGLLLGGIAAILMLVARPQGKLQAVIIYGFAAALGFSLTISPYLWLNWQLTGGLLPNTANAKFEQHAVLLQEAYAIRYFNLVVQIFAGAQFLLIPTIAAYAYFAVKQENRLKGLFLLLPLLWGLGHIALYAARLPATYQHGRYVLPTLVAFVFVGAVGLIWLLNLPSLRKNRLLRLSIRVLGLSTVALFITYVPIGMNAFKTDVEVINSEMVATAEYIAENIPSAELLAIHDIGAVGYFAPRPMIDIAGLVSPEIVPIVANPDTLWQYMEEKGAVYLMAFPDQIPNENPNDSRLCRVFYTDSEITRRQLGEGNSMAVYRLAWDGNCSN